MTKGCKVCWGAHVDGQGECSHWCHFAGAEDWDTDGGGEADGDGE